MSILSFPSFVAGLGTGDSLNAILGTGESGPAGVEAIIEYNGIYMNERSWIDTYLITSIDGLADADVRDQREVNPAQHGETAFDAFYGGRTIVLTGKVRAHTVAKLRDMQLALRQAFSPLVELALIFHGKTPQRSLVIWCRKSQSLAMGETQQNNLFERDFQITLRASNPRFTSLLPTNISMDTADFNSDAVDAVNVGNFEAQPTISLAGPMTAPELHNETTQDILDLSGDIAPGETVVIDTAKNRMVTGAGVNVFNRLDPASDWITIAPGLNKITAHGADVDSNSFVTIEWRHTVM